MVADAAAAAHAVDPETLPEPEQAGFPKWNAEPDAATYHLTKQSKMWVQGDGTKRVQQNQRRSQGQHQKLQKQTDKLKLQSPEVPEIKQSWQPQWRQQWARRRGPATTTKTKTASRGWKVIAISAASPFTERKLRIQGSGDKGDPRRQQRNWYRSGNSGTSAGEIFAAFRGGCLPRGYCTVSGAETSRCGRGGAC